MFTYVNHFCKKQGIWFSIIIFANVDWISKILSQSLSDVQGNFVCTRFRVFTSPQVRCYITLLNLKIKSATNFNGVLHLRPQNSSRQLCDRLIADTSIVDYKVWRTVRH